MSPYKNQTCSDFRSPLINSWQCTKLQMLENLPFSLNLISYLIITLIKWISFYLLLYSFYKCWVRNKQSFNFFRTISPRRRMATGSAFSFPTCTSAESWRSESSCSAAYPGPSTSAWTTCLASGTSRAQARRAGGARLSSASFLSRWHSLSEPWHCHFVWWAQ